MTTFIVIVLLIVVVGLVVAGALGIGLFSYGERARAKAEDRAPAILDSVFDGSDDVVYKVNMESVSYETAVLGAKERGYRLVAQSDDVEGGAAKTLIFERT